MTTEDTASGWRMSRDARRMLYAIEAYTDRPNGDEGWPWLKEYVIAVIVHLGIDDEVFTGYDKAPSLFAFHGIKRFAMVSQEANLDLAEFFRRNYIDKMLLSTWYYATTRAVRIADPGRAVLAAELTQEDRDAVDTLIRCPRCRSVLDFAVVSTSEAAAGEPGFRSSADLKMLGVCACRTKGRHRRSTAWMGHALGTNTLERFFDIGEVAYVSRPYFPGDAT